MIGSKNTLQKTKYILDESTGEMSGPMFFLWLRFLQQIKRLK